MLPWTFPVLTGLDGRPLVVDVYDGDTVRLVLDAGCDAAVHPWLRVKDVHCPELRQVGGPEARAFTAATLTAAAEVRVTTFGRSFARWVADISVDGRDLAALIVEAGHGTTSRP